MDNEKALKPYRALYLHIPFCKSRCSYCDFATHAARSGSNQIDRYIEGLILEIRRASREELLGEIETVYIGGGTPTHAGMRNLSSLLYALGTSMHLEPHVECTVEANPESLSSEMIRDLWALGVNRLSIGVQSFNDGTLHTLGRAHDGARAREAVEIARERFDNISIDLMCGIAGQTLAFFLDDLKTAVTLGINHISIYPLAIEEGTPFESMVDSGLLPEPDGDVQAEMMQVAQDYLTAQGFKRYEIASYARPGYESRHNTAYWTGVPYLGLGQSAVTMSQTLDNSVRRRLLDGNEQERLNARQIVAEDLMLKMRMVRGVSLLELDQSAKVLPAVWDCFNDLVDCGLAEKTEEAYIPTNLGWLCGNELFGAILELAP